MTTAPTADTTPAPRRRMTRAEHAEEQARLNAEEARAVREAMCAGCFTVPAASGVCLC